LSHEERVAAITAFRYTNRQARFLDIVMRHAGVCLQRQYSAFAGTVHGQRTRAFFAKLLRRHHASCYECRHNRGRVYQVHHLPLYKGIGQPNSRHRRPIAAGRVVERLMMLDAVLAGADVTWFATENEIQGHVAGLGSPADETLTIDLGQRASMAVDLSTEALRIGVDPNGRTVLLHLLGPSGLEDLRTFLGRAAPLLVSLPTWTLQLAFPRALSATHESYQRVVREEWETPLHPRTVDELRWYFEQRRSLRPGQSPFPVDARFERAATAFQGPRFDRLYRRWLRGRVDALTEAVSPAISGALANGSGRLESLVLDHSYEHLSPVRDRLRGAASRFENSVEVRSVSELQAAEPIIQPG
jgi:hypothetical protein